jgi:hypothetical protein
MTPRILQHTDSTVSAMPLKKPLGVIRASKACSSLY